MKNMLLKNKTDYTKEKRDDKDNQTIVIKNSTPLKEILKLAPPCMCDACSNGCKFGSGSLIINEKLGLNDVKNIAKHLNISEEELKKNYLEEIRRFNTKTFRTKLLRKKTPDGKELPFGRCIFYDDKIGCKIHEVKPVECKISMGCKDYSEQLSQWFMLNFFVSSKDPESLRQYNAYLKSGGKTLVDGKLNNIMPDKKLLAKILNYEILS